MREIKFRAWDKKRKKMFRVWKLNFIGQTHNVWDAEEDLQFNIDHDLLELMQFTGIKDKNGKEIYEGDIFNVVNLHDGDEYMWNNTEQKSIPQVVIWDEKYCRFDFGVSTRIKHEPYDFEVIGNIYEKAR